MVFDRLYNRLQRYYYYYLKKYYRYSLIKNGILIDRTVTLVDRPHITLTSEFWYSEKGEFIFNKDVKVGRNFNCECYGGKVIIGEGTTIGQNSTFYGHGGIEIGKNTLIAMNCIIVSSNHQIPSRNESIKNMKDTLLPVKIGSDVWIGARVTILGGVIIGDGCVVGAGSLVTKDLPPYSVSIGTPAKVIRFR